MKRFKMKTNSLTFLFTFLIFVFSGMGVAGIEASEAMKWLDEVPPPPAEIPIGTVIDWWCPDDSFLIPDGFQICDGSVVTDSESPFYGYNLPDLRDAFVSGAATVYDIGTTGGAATHSHTHDHPLLSHSHIVNPPGTGTTTDGAHQHSINPPNTASETKSIDHSHSVNMPSLYTYDDTHNHCWSVINTDEEWFSFNDDNEFVSIVNWGDGMDASGWGEYPLSYSGEVPTNTYYYTNNDTHNHYIPQRSGNTTNTTGGNHSHNVDIAAFNSSLAGDHDHFVDIPAFSSESGSVNLPQITSSEESSLPPYVQLLKIIKIK